jgi:hypothetical protein
LLFREDKTRKYCPLAGCESLYRTLAAASPTPKGILEFARQYGPLGEGVEEITEMPDGSLRFVEPLRAWRNAIGWLSEAVRLWDLVQKGDSATLSKVIRWDGNKTVRYRATKVFWSQVRGTDKELPPDQQGFLDELNTIAGTNFHPEIFATFPVGDVIGPARYFVLQLVNAYLETTAQPGLLWDNKHKRILLRNYPLSLLGAIFLQFSTAILSGRETRTCMVCQRYFEVTALASRNDRLTCSNRCRVRAYRDRQAKARELHKKSWSPKQISKEIGSDVSTIKKWLAQTKE